MWNKCCVHFLHDVVPLLYLAYFISVSWIVNLWLRCFFFGGGPDFAMPWYYINSVCRCEHHGNVNFLISDHLGGWALFKCIVYRGISHWSRQDMCGRRGLNEGENTWTISRENMRFSWLLFTLWKTWEPNRIDPDSTETPATSQLTKRIWFLPCGEEGNWSRTLFWSS